MQVVVRQVTVRCDTIGMKSMMTRYWHTGVVRQQILVHRVHLWSGQRAVDTEHLLD